MRFKVCFQLDLAAGFDAPDSNHSSSHYPQYRFVGTELGKIQSQLWKGSEVLFHFNDSQ